MSSLSGEKLVLIKRQYSRIYYHNLKETHRNSTEAGTEGGGIAKEGSPRKAVLTGHLEDE